MDILQKIGTIVRSLLGQEKPPMLDKADLLNAIEDIIEYVNLVEDALQRPSVNAALEFLRHVGVKTTPEIQHIQKIYHAFFQRLSGRCQQLERNAPFSSIARCASIMQTDLTALREHFTTVFGTANEAEVPLNEITVAMAMAIGYVNEIEFYCTWVVYFIAQIKPIPGTRLPLYQLNFVDENAERIAELTRSCVDRPTSTSILSEIATIKRNGTDLKLETAGQTIDTYADDRQYSRDVLSSLNGFTLRNPILIAGNAINVFRRWRYEVTKAKREWLAAKVGYLTLESQGLDSNSAEAQRLQKLITFYAEQVATLDKKLGTSDDARSI